MSRLSFSGKTLLWSGGGALALLALSEPSALLGFAAVVLPQTIACVALARRGAARAFGAWALKFSLTVLLLAVTIRLSHEAGALSPLALVGGVAAGAVANIILAARWRFAVA